MEFAFVGGSRVIIRFGFVQQLRFMKYIHKITKLSKHGKSVLL
jgi:hypothetical protein